ncbi:hypothetical protein SAICODRAFT_10441 [Saitoella complicata NRRL Y-17804]|uniref:GST N-terminal domain-containing protein n=1 Tax=Saitoella complicata (strain BCRC 22490 / CBS 7301 / JCM 7358 / NBRC 10748 / NRRL Y-17804) TaxID=698492 RepID=A0A0E9ND74_SAICN|nr:uncharacterized protein SAICODRAFT_10441 [Saitoella complicata NRRL Y-17804]ODQ49917.1 hypothetical protein SAICODRAFT_10441 [Saitoella complicata NRRL Y-17804]GAO47661.1 hypothetical protein G7K_1860-t1 [Saitoella complicata NRRL Y-17804]
MATTTDPPLLLYDLLSSLQPPQWSPHTLRTRLLLNYLNIPFRTEFLSYPDIEPTLADLGLEGVEPVGGWERGPGWTVPVLLVPGGEGEGEAVSGTWGILGWVQKHWPEKATMLGDLEMAKAIGQKIFEEVITPARTVIWPVLPHILDERGQVYFRQSRQRWLGKDIESLLAPVEEQERIWAELRTTLRGLQPSGGERFLGGDGGPGYADFILVACLGWIKAVCPADWARIMAKDQDEGAEVSWLRSVWDGCEKWMV